MKAILRGAKKYYNDNSSPQFIIHTVSLNQCQILHPDALTNICGSLEL